jgi:hypothetical protein
VTRSPRSTLPTGRVPWRAATALLAVLAALPLAGCLEKPGIEDRWTRIDLLSTSAAPGEVVTAGVRDSFTVNGTITYRAIVTGYAVAELRASSSVSNASVTLDPKANRITMASDIDRILAQSVPCGRVVRPITGWDHLVQTMTLSFGAVPPAADSAGATSGLFLLFYLGSGEKIELRDGTDSIAVTPFVSSEKQVLPIGLKLRYAGWPS